MSTVNDHIQEYLRSTAAIKTIQPATPSKWRPLVKKSFAIVLPLTGMLIIGRTVIPRSDDFVEPTAFDAVSAGNVDSVQASIAKTPSVLTQYDFEGNTLLYAAVANGKPKIVDLLLANGADPNVPNQAGDTPLAAALHADRNQLPMIRALLQNGAAADKLLPEGGNALHLAARSHRLDRRVLALLVRNHIAIHARNAKGQTPLQVAQEQGALDVVQMLADAG